MTEKQNETYAGELMRTNKMTNFTEAVIFV